MPLSINDVLYDALKEGRLYSINHTSPSIAAAGNYLVGLTTGSRPVVYHDRTYISDVASFLVELFRVDYTGGTPIAVSNRNFVIGGSGPVTHVAAPTATPANLVASVRALAGTSTGNAQAQIPENEKYILDANTQYVLRLTNTASGAAVITFRWTYQDLPSQE